MSASLFDSYADYEPYPSTDYVEGDKSFGELKNGDIIYALKFISIKDGFSWTELKVEREWHTTKGHCYLGCVDGKKKKIINFGPSNCANVFSDAKSNSIVWYDDMVIGTNKESVYQKEYEGWKEYLDGKRKEFEYALKKVALLEKAKA
jgi:hypothetical protein